MRSHPSPTAAEFFGSMVEEYDSLIRRAVPRYDEMIGRLIAYLPRRAERVLELGCGTGNLSVALPGRYPDAAITFVDAAPEMVAITRSRLEAVAPLVAERAEFTVVRFEEIALRESGFDEVDCVWRSGMWGILTAAARGQRAVHHRV